MRAFPMSVIGQRRKVRVETATTRRVNLAMSMHVLDSMLPVTRGLSRKALLDVSKGLAPQHSNGRKAWASFMEATRSRSSW
jgi:hypothetical protein